MYICICRYTFFFITTNLSKSQRLDNHTPVAPDGNRALLQTSWDPPRVALATVSKTLNPHRFARGLFVSWRVVCVVRIRQLWGSIRWEITRCCARACRTAPYGLADYTWLGELLILAHNCQRWIDDGRFVAKFSFGTSRWRTFRKLTCWVHGFTGSQIQQLDAGSGLHAAARACGPPHTGWRTMPNSTSCLVGTHLTT